MTPIERAALLAAPYGPQLPIEQLVVELNLIYHKYEAKAYDETHPEIFSQAADVWAEMCQTAKPLLPNRSLRVLDYGCGTGFAASQFISNFGVERIGELVCFDPSEEMLSRCRTRLKDFAAATTFVTKEPIDTFDVVLTNSLLHHLPDISRFIETLTSHLSPAGIWMQGHEPNRKYYSTPECRNLARECLRRERAQKMGTLTWWLTYPLAKLGLAATPERDTGRMAKHRGLFSRVPSPYVVSRLVDFHVPGSESDAAIGLGLAVEDIRAMILSRANLRWSKTYNYLGRSHRVRRTPDLNLKIKEMEITLPDCGSNFSSLWDLQP